MFPLFIGEACYHNYYRNNVKHRVDVGGVYKIFEFLKEEKEEFYVVAITGEDLNLGFEDEKLILCRDNGQKTSSVNLHDLETTKSQVEFKISNLNKQLIIDYLKDFDLKNHLIYCPIFPTYEKVVHYILEKTSSVILDFGFIDWIGKPEIIIKQIRSIKSPFEIAQINGGDLSSSDLEAIREELYKVGCRKIIITNGIKPLLIIDKGKQFSYNPITIDCIDNFGAGDIFISGFMTSFIKGQNMLEAIKHGNNCSIRYLKKINKRFL